MDTYEKLGFWVINGLGDGSTFGMDGKESIVTRKFAGVKMIPYGFHVAVLGTHDILRTGAMTFIGPQHQIVQTTLSDDQLANEEDEDYVEEIYTIERLKTMDGQMAVYEGSEKWPALCSFITKDTMTRCVGRRDMGFVNSYGSVGYPERLVYRDEAWPLERIVNALLPRGSETCDAETFTLYVRDKSFFVHELVCESYGGKYTEYLADMQMFYVLLTRVYAVEMWAVYAQLVACACRMGMRYVPEDKRRGSKELRGVAMLPFLLGVLKVLVCHVEDISEEMLAQEFMQDGRLYREETAHLRRTVQDIAHFWQGSALWADIEAEAARLGALVEERLGAYDDEDGDEDAPVVVPL